MTEDDEFVLYAKIRRLLNKNKCTIAEGERIIGRVLNEIKFQRRCAEYETAYDAHIGKKSRCADDDLIDVIRFDLLFAGLECPLYERLKDIDFSVE